MVFIGLLSTIIEIISMILFFIVVFYVCNIGLIVKGINGWKYIAGGFLLIIFRNFSGFLLKTKIDLDGKIIMMIIGLVEPIILLLITVLFIIGFYKLNQDFEKIRKNKLKKRQMKNALG